MPAFLLLLLAAAQPAAAPPPKGAIDVTASIIAYRDWRLCLDSRLGPPPRARRPKRKALAAALATCRSNEEALRTALAAAWGPVEGAAIFAKFARDTRAELGAPQPGP
jgi:hypothetical protein